MIAILLANDIPNDHQIEHLKAIVYTRFRTLQIEPPMPDRVERLVRSALHTYEQQFCATIHAQLSPETLLQMDALLSTVTIAEQADEPPADGSFVRSAFQELKLDPGPLTLESVLTELPNSPAFGNSGSRRRSLLTCRPRLCSTTASAPRLRPLVRCGRLPSSC